MGYTSVFFIYIYIYIYQLLFKYDSLDAPPGMCENGGLAGWLVKRKPAISRFCLHFVNKFGGFTVQTVGFQAPGGLGTTYMWSTFLKTFEWFQAPKTRMVHQSSGHFTRSLAFTEPWDGLCHGFVCTKILHFQNHFLDSWNMSNVQKKLIRAISSRPSFPRLLWGNFWLCLWDNHFSGLKTGHLFGPCHHLGPVLSQPVPENPENWDLMDGAGIMVNVGGTHA